MSSLLIAFLAVAIPSCLARPEQLTDRYAAPVNAFLPTSEAQRFTASAPVYGPPQPEYGTPVQAEYGPPPAQKLVTKNIYLHVPPPEEEEYQPAQVFEKPIPRKHYKIVFIKAPSPPVPTVPVIPEQPQDEHKTLVYVLVKKPEPLPQIEIPKVKPTEPSKPEVFFIKYKADEDKTATEYQPPRPVYGQPA